MAVWQATVADPAESTCRVHILYLPVTERSGLSNAGDLRILVTSIECLIAVDSLFPCLTASYRLVSSGYLMLLLQTIQHHFPGLLTTLCLTRKALKNAQFW